MAPAGGDSWLAEYNACERLGQDIMEKINEYRPVQRTSSEFVQKSRNIRAALKQFSSDLNILTQNLNRASTSYHITARELGRRQSLLHSLNTRKIQLEEAFTNCGRGQGFERSPFSLAGAPSSHYSRYEETDETRILSLDDIKLQQNQVVQVQDEGLEALSKVISRQKVMAKSIGTEVDFQNELIDDITDHVDRVDQKLIRETKHVKIVTQKSNSGCYWGMIILLLIAIIVIACIPGK